MLTLMRGDLFSARVDAMVNPVNTHGVMGKGLALEFKKRYPQNFVAYKAAFERGELEVGRMFSVPTGALEPRFIVNFPTKQHWRNPSKLEYVEHGLITLVGEIERLELKSVAIPALGCGLGDSRGMMF
jgi:O-acetyl-ADP-ribose deacetylase (regulator of RNase III)